MDSSWLLNSSRAAGTKKPVDRFSVHLCDVKHSKPKRPRKRPFLKTREGSWDLLQHVLRLLVQVHHYWGHWWEGFYKLRNLTNFSTSLLPPFVCVYCTMSCLGLWLSDVVMAIYLLFINLDVKTIIFKIFWMFDVI